MFAIALLRAAFVSFVSSWWDWGFRVKQYHMIFTAIYARSISIEMPWPTPMHIVVSA